MLVLEGFLFYKLQYIGTKSEGPKYFLQLLEPDGEWEYPELGVIKEVAPWENDPKLHKFVNHKVTLKGECTPEGIAYDDVTPLETPLGVRPKRELILDLELGCNHLEIDLSDPGKPRNDVLEMILTVLWPYRSIWQGECPTGQHYEFHLEREGRCIRTWSEGMLFTQVVTPVQIPGGSPQPYHVRWALDDPNSLEEGEYVVRGIFIASGDEAVATFHLAKGPK